MDTTAKPTFHRSVAAGARPVKGVSCNHCGAYVGLVKGNSGKWYTCELVRSMRDGSSELMAYPFQPHSRNCQRVQAEADLMLLKAEFAAELAPLQDAMLAACASGDIDTAKALNARIVAIAESARYAALKG